MARTTTSSGLAFGVSVTRAVATCCSLCSSQHRHSTHAATPFTPAFIVRGFIVASEQTNADGFTRHARDDAIVDRHQRLGRSQQQYRAGISHLFRQRALVARFVFNKQKLIRRRTSGMTLKKINSDRPNEQIGSAIFQPKYYVVLFRFNSRRSTIRTNSAQKYANLN